MYTTTNGTAGAATRFAGQPLFINANKDGIGWVDPQSGKERFVPVTDPNYPQTLAAIRRDCLRGPGLNR